MKLSVGLKVANSLSLTPQLQQAIRLLQLSSLELEQEIQQQLESNPLLELVDDYNDYGENPGSSDKVTDNNQKDNQEYQDAAADEYNNDAIPEDLPVDTDWDEIFTDHSPTLTTEIEEREDNRSGEEDLADHLLWQINLLHLSGIEKVIAHCIVDALDERGYLTCDLDEICEATIRILQQAGIEEDVEEEEVHIVLKLIQRLEPVGVASRNLVECLLVQLENFQILQEKMQQGIGTPQAEQTFKQVTHAHEQLTSLLSPELITFAKELLSHSELLISNDIMRLMRYTQLNLDQLKGAMDLLKTFDPAPGAQYQNRQTEYQTPDVIVQKKNDRWHVFLNPDILPKLRVNHYYASMIKRADQSEDNQYLKHQMQEAKNFIKGIDDRHATLLRVATCIVEHQIQFFEIGAEGMKPLILKDIAEELDLHESTISRVTTNKYILTPRGLFELKYFFSSHVSTTTGGEFSSTAIRAIIKKYIANENPKKPLSDSAITKLLQDEGIDVARRTVAKYRESLNIPSSSERKILI